MAFDFSDLRGRITSKYKTQGAFAAAMGLKESALSARLNNGVAFKADEIKLAAQLLDIPDGEINKYFFTV